MRTSGHGDDRPMVLLPIAIAIVIAVMLLGGPTATLEIINDMVRDVAHAVLRTVDGLL